jgi:fatty-acid desaturase
MKTSLKCKNDEFLVTPLKNVLSAMGLVNHPGTPKLWAIAHENGHKRKNNKFLVMPLKHILSVMGLVNKPGTPKPWAIAHKNGHKRKNIRVFCDSSPKCTDCHIPCKSPWNPKTMGYSS